MSGTILSKRTPVRRTSRRAFLRGASLGLTAAASPGLVLAADAQSTPNDTNLEAYIEAFKEQLAAVAPKEWKATPDTVERPFYREGAPFRAKISPPGAPGEILVIHGRVWGLETKRPLPHAVLEVWQADAQGRYDQAGPRKPIHPAVFLNRASMITDETGYYEFETVRPGPPPSTASALAANRIHFVVRHPGYRTMTTQLFFRGDLPPAGDSAIHPALVIDLNEHRAGQAVFKTGRFDIVLEPA